MGETKCRRLRRVDTVDATDPAVDVIADIGATMSNVIAGVGVGGADILEDSCTGETNKVCKLPRSEELPPEQLCHQPL